VRLLPPLIIDDEQAQQIIDIVAHVVLAFLGEADRSGAG